MPIKLHVNNDIYVRERKFHGTFAPRSESSRERTFQGAKVPPMELSLPGAKVRGNESSIIRLFCVAVVRNTKIKFAIVM